ncbi:hypothetical protein ABN028_20025 [Actinopolymorpha sp. B17G11]|uniref:hypothetical protein n=1 Tax=Actinopolymorpha sp. B17G11 TaxID=3160861 RepID=UPI0032E52369
MAEKAGELEVPVVADLSGFARELKRKVEAAAEGVQAKIEAVVDEKGLRQELERAVERAAAGVKAKVEVEVDEDQAQSNISGLLERLAKRLTIPLGTKGEVADNVVAESAKGQAVAQANPVEVPVKGQGGRLLRDVLLERLRAQAAVQKAPINIPITMRLRGVMAGLRGLAMAAILPLVQPAIAAIGSLAAGLGALSAAAAPSVGILGGIPGILAAIIQGAVGVKIAMSGVGDAFKESISIAEKQAQGLEVTEADLQKLKAAMDKLSPSAQLFVKRAVSLRDEWQSFKKAVQEPLFEPLARQIKPVAAALLPDLERGLAGTSKVVGEVVDNFGDFVRTPVFRADFRTILSGNNRLLESFGKALGDVGVAFVDIVVASQPFLRRIGQATERLGAWIRNISHAGRESGRFAAFLDRAGDTAGQLWRIIKNLGGGLFGVFRAGTEQGQKLLDKMEASLARFDQWANSPKGQKALKQWYEDAMPGFLQLVGLIGDVGKALGRMSTNENLAPMIQQLRDDVIPALENFLTTLAENMGPEVIDALSSLADALQHLAEVGGPLGTFITIIDKALLEPFGKFAEDNPEIVKALGQLLGALLAFKAAKGIFNLIGIGKLAGGIGGLLLGGKGGKHKAGGGGGGGLAASLFGGLIPAAAAMGPRIKAALAKGIGGVGGLFGKGATKGADAAARGVDKFTKAVDGSKVALGAEMVADAKKETALGGVGGAADKSGKKVGFFSRMLDGTKKALGAGVTALGTWGASATSKVGSTAAKVGRNVSGMARMVGTVAVSWAADSARAIAGMARMTAAVAAHGARQAASWVGNQAKIKAASIGTWAAAQARAVAGMARMTAVVVAEGAKQAAASARNAARIVAGWVLMGAQALIQAARMAAAWFIALGPVGWVIAAIIAIVALIIANWSKIGPFVTALWNKVWSVVSGAVSKVINWVKTNWPLLLAILTGPVGLAVMFIIRNWDKIKAKTSQIFNGIVNFLRGVLAKIVSFVASQVANMKTRFDNGVANIKRAIESLKALPGRVRAFFQQLVDAVQEKVDAAVRVATRLKDRVLGFFRSAGGWLKNAGKSVIDGLIDGITSKISEIGATMSRAADKVRAYWPFSPAKEGPLRRFPLDKAGANLVGMLTDGILAEQGQLVGAMRRITGLVAEPTRATDPMAMWKDTERRQTFTPTQAVDRGVTFQDGAIRIYNPTPEPASESAAKKLPRIAEFGLFGAT